MMNQVCFLLYWFSTFNLRTRFSDTTTDVSEEDPRIAIRQALNEVLRSTGTCLTLLGSQRSFSHDFNEVIRAQEILAEVHKRYQATTANSEGRYSPNTSGEDSPVRQVAVCSAAMDCNMFDVTGGERPAMIVETTPSAVESNIRYRAAAHRTLPNTCAASCNVSTGELDGSGSQSEPRKRKLANETGSGMSCTPCTSCTSC
jgi:hypothetical protein